MSDNAAKLLQTHKGLLPANSPVPNRRILVVDDEPEIVSGIQQILCPETSPFNPKIRSSRVKSTEKTQKADEFEIVAVTTPEQALQAVTEALRDQRPFAMGFFDVVLNHTKIDGIELVRQIFAMDSRMYAVFVTAYQDRSVDAIGALFGEENRERWDYINKPFTAGEILQKARSVTSLWDLHRLKEWQQERLSELNQLLHSQERHNAAAAVGRSVAHEFGNIFTHIVGNAEIALEKMDAGSMKNALDIILKATDTATNVLKRLRELNSKGEVVPASPIDAWRAVQDALELVDFQLRKRFVRVSLSRAEKFMIQGNRHSLVQVFVNILINAMHAMPDGGDVQIRGSTVGGTVEIVVRDTGPGVPEDLLPRLMEPLFTTKGAEGSGLGLSICKEIVEYEHGGELVIRNHSAGGLEILIRLPMESESGNP